jgi:hypothetical protein
MLKKVDMDKQPILKLKICMIYDHSFALSQQSTLPRTKFEKEEFECEITKLEEEVEALEDLKEQFPDLQFKLKNYSKLK